MINRVIIMVLDGFGVGEAPDAKKYGDDSSRSFVNGILASIVKEKKIAE